ncbi:hypothetical protein D3C80_201260 [compost metagenome]
MLLKFAGFLCHESYLKITEGGRRAYPFGKHCKINRSAKSVCNVDGVPEIARQTSSHHGYAQPTPKDEDALTRSRRRRALPLLENALLAPAYGKCAALAWSGRKLNIAAVTGDDLVDHAEPQART